jgi:hypothetical protein
MTMRWQAGSRTVGDTDLKDLWATRDSGRKLMIAGAGFDPRMPVAYELVSSACPVPVDLVLIRLEPLPTDPATEGLAKQGRERADAAVAAAGATLLEHAGQTGSQSSSMTIARDFFAAKLIDDYDELIVDVSALPRAVAFPLIRGLLQMEERSQWSGDLHVVACDNPRIDRLVSGEGIDTPDSLPGFGAHAESNSDATLIWVPVLGEAEARRVGDLYADISADEVCPVLPFPSRNPRRADDLIKEYRELLFDRIAVEPRNFIHASETNPFDLYRTLSQLRESYAESLEPLGETRMVLSTHSSKLLSIGVLLAAYELGLEVRHASPTLYTVEDLEALDGFANENLVVDLWLTGEPYA